MRLEGDDTVSNPARVYRIVHDLRSYAQSGVTPVYAAKLLAAAAELEALIGGDGPLPATD